MGSSPSHRHPDQYLNPCPSPYLSRYHNTLGFRLKMWSRHPLLRMFHPKFHPLGSWLTEIDLPSTRRRAYVFAPPPKRRTKQPAGTPLLCKVNGCDWSTTVRGKQLARHRASHFKGKTGVMCPQPGCKKIFSRSSLCGNHLRECHPERWAYIAATKGTQDAWGIRIGRELIENSLV
jgi:hypothetical protein